jgi:hypothetical protein
MNDWKIRAEEEEDTPKKMWLQFCDCGKTIHMQVSKLR